jgi:hypothetical protein
VEVDTETVLWYHLEAEQKIKAKEISVNDGATGIQSVMEAAAAVVSLSGVATTKTALANDPQKFKAKKPSPSKRKTPASNAKKPAHPMIRYFGYVFLNSSGTRPIMAQRVFPGQKMVQTMYLQIGFIISGRDTKIMYCWIHTRVS